MKTEGTRNCPNCGAVLEKDLIKCPYCGTSYFDFVNIDVTAEKPFYMKIKIPQGIVTAKVIAFPTASFDLETDYTDIRNKAGDIIYKMCKATTLNIHMDFQALADDNHLCTLKI